MHITTTRFAAAAGVALVLQFADAQAPPRALATPQPQSAAAAREQPPAGVVIAEVLFEPLPGSQAFVELLNTGVEAADLSRMVVRVGAREVLLARVADPLAAGARLVIRFDGEAGVEPRVIHAPADVPLAADSGEIHLLDDLNEPVDRVAWGAAPGAVRYGAAGIAAETIAAGSTIGRPPGANRVMHPLDWVVYPPAQATPGAPNPLPAVAEMLLSSGVIVTEPTVSLGWYAVPGAADYRVQIATDPGFAAIRVDQVVATPTYQAGPLGPGQYYWRVQARPADGTPAAFSKASIILLRTPASAGRRSPDVLLRQSPNQAPSASTLPLPNVLLAVPQVIQHKDTQLLQLENPVDGGAHAWDVDHVTLNTSDPADIGNCLLASTAMLNRFYKGNLSQDRLAYEALGPPAITHLGRLIAAGHSMTGSMLIEPQQGPEGDFVYGSALSVKRAFAALTFALGAAPRPERVFNNADFMWNFVKSELDAGRPAILFTTHAVVVRGYGIGSTGHRLLWLNNPSHGLEVIDVSADPWPGLASWIFMPLSGVSGRQQESSVTTDTDGDGVYDFDEVQRFHTDPGEVDSDDDEVDDFEDIYSGVFEIQHRYGYAFAPSAPSKGRDFDGDGLPTERDPDSDNGGCRDGLEDANGNGRRDSGETDNFDDTDDRCQELQGSISWNTVIENTPDGNTRTYEHVRGLVRVKLRASRAGLPDNFEDDGSSYEFRRTTQATFAGPGCTLVTRSWTAGADRFTGDGASIGAVIGDAPPPPPGSPPRARELKEMALGAQGPGRGHATNDLCTMAEQGPIDDAFSLPDCPGLQDANDPRTFHFNCTRPVDPSPVPGVRIIHWNVSGTVRLP